MTSQLPVPPDQSPPSTAAAEAQLPLDDAASEPVISGSTSRVLDLVMAAYGQSLEHAAQTLATSHDTATATPIVRAAIDYCASRICDQTQRYCEGCRLASEHRGLKNLDEFCRQFASISFRQSPLELTPGGPRPPQTFENLEQLSRTWSGDEVYYLARRVVRRLKKQDEPRPKRMTGGLDAGPMPTLILVRPQLAENIGMVARAMANFGLDELRLVARTNARVRRHPVPTSSSMQPAPYPRSTQASPICSGCAPPLPASGTLRNPS
jgi:tRNA/rRNA methyltransferase